jgi:membrane protein required for colicin V production
LVAPAKIDFLACYSGIRDSESLVLLVGKKHRHGGLVVAFESYDLVMLGLLATTGVLGYFKGIVWQIAWIAGICLSSFVAMRFSAELAPLIGQPPPWNRLLAMLALYVGTSIVVWLTFRVVSTAIDAVHLSAFDHQLGLVFGLAKGALICVVVTFFAVTMMPAYRSQITGSKSGQIVAKLIGEADQYLPPQIHETVDPFLQQFHQQFDGSGTTAASGIAGENGSVAEPMAGSWQAVLDGVTSVAAWAGVDTAVSKEDQGQGGSAVAAAAAWLPATSGSSATTASRYANQQSAFGAAVPTAFEPATTVSPVPSAAGQTGASLPARFPIGAQSALPATR